MRLGAVIAVAVLAAFGETASAAAPVHVNRAPTGARVSELRPILEGNVFAGGPCLSPLFPGGESYSTQLEPSLAVNPRDSSDLVASWFDASYQLYGVAVSSDAGRTWRMMEVPGLARCTGAAGNVEEVDEGLSFGPDGSAYLSAQANSADSDTSRILVARSVNGGASWSAPALVSPPDGFNDKQRGPVLIDPYNPAQDYLAWRRGRDDTGLVAGSDVFFSQTRDGGQTWSLPAPIYLGQAPGEWDMHNTLFSTGRASLLDVFIRMHTQDWIPGANGAGAMPEEILALRSIDGGATWSAPRSLATTSYKYPVAADGEIIEGFPAVYSAQAPDGTVYSAWNDIISNSDSRIWITASHDGGSTWTKSAIVARIHGQAFLPAVAVDPGGVIGVTWYDTRNERAGSKQTTTDVWFAYSKHLSDWRQIHLAGPFDMQTAATATFFGLSGRFVGDYTGLVGVPGGFAADFALAKPQAHVGQSSIFFARITLTRSRSCQRLPKVLSITMPRHRGRIISAVIYVDGRWAKTVHGTRLTRVRLTTPKLKRFALRIVAHTNHQRTIITTHRYNRCP